MSNRLDCWQFYLRTDGMKALWAPASWHISVNPEKCCGNRNEAHVAVVSLPKTAPQRLEAKGEGQNKGTKAQ